MMKSLKSTNLKPSITISPVTKWVLTLVILGAGIILVVFLYTQEQSRHDQLQKEVDRAGSTLVQNSLQQRDLTSKLAVANLTLAEKRLQVPPSGQTMTVEEALYNAASEADVKVMSINCPKPSAEAVGGATYQVFGITISVEGGDDNLLYFSGHLGYWLPTASIESVSTGQGGMTVVLKVYALA